MKRTQVKRLAEGLENPVHPRIWKYFDALAAGEYQTAEAHGDFLNQRAPDRTVLTIAWPAVNDTIGVYESFRDWSPKYRERFGKDIIASIPRGSIFFGGTDPGRYLITYYSKSHERGDPFFTITQNQLASSMYVDYIRELYSSTIKTPSVADSQKAFEDYIKDATLRMSTGMLRPGEIVSTNNGQASVSGQVAVMSINALLSKTIIDNNPDREFYIEESFPMEWMLPHLTPHQLIMKINREPVAEFTAETVAQDHEYWSKVAGGMIGDWLDYDTSVSEVAKFSRKTYLDRNYANFTGDLRFLRDESAQKSFSKLRTGIANLYSWRANDDALRNNADEQKRMIKESEFAFKQAFALCPYSPEVVFKYAKLLMSLAKQDPSRLDDALAIAEVCRDLDPGNDQVKGLVRKLKKLKAASK